MSVFKSFSHRMGAVAVLGLFISLAGGGCGSSSNASADGAPIKQRPKMAKINYWIDQPGIVSTTSTDYARLWEACSQAARDRFFVLDRTDYRQGVLTTQPLVSRQFFEPWRGDVNTIDGTVQSSLQSIRRTVHFTIEKSDGSFTATPKVIVERFSERGRQITSPSQFQQAFAYKSVSGSPERDAGKPDADLYWYAIGRDSDLEKALADSVGSKLR